MKLFINYHKHSTVVLYEIQAFAVNLYNCTLTLIEINEFFFFVHVAYVLKLYILPFQNRLSALVI